MYTFEQARKFVEEDPGGGPTEGYGYESPGRWFPVIAPEAAGAMVPGVDKRTGELTWIPSIEDEYQDAPLVGERQ